MSPCPHNQKPTAKTYPSRNYRVESGNHDRRPHTPNNSQNRNKKGETELKKRKKEAVLGTSFAKTLKPFYYRPPIFFFTIDLTKTITTTRGTSKIRVLDAPVKFISLLTVVAIVGIRATKKTTPNRISIIESVLIAIKILLETTPI